jgi:hypothetical protein
MQQYGAAVLMLTELPESARCSFAAWKSTGIDLGHNGWRVKFTGRTQRDAIVTGESAYIATAQQKEN